MADLVEIVALIIDNGVDEPPSWVAKDAIAAVLDDMAEPSLAVCLAGSYAAVGANPGIDAWQAMLAQYRKEMLGED